MRPSKAVITAAINVFSYEWGMEPGVFDSYSLSTQERILEYASIIERETGHRELQEVLAAAIEMASELPQDKTARLRAVIDGSYSRGVAAGPSPQPQPTDESPSQSDDQP